MNISAKISNDFLVSFTSKFLRIFGFIVVMFVVVQASNAKIDNLKLENSTLAANYVPAKDVLKQLDCLTRNIYWEAGSEPFEGKVGVAQVTMNRLNDGRFADSVCGVVYQKNVVYVSI
jgi:spore germination cell wall hydrolase CwlJ-like protein